MKISKYILAAALASLSLVACNNDGDFLTTKGAGDVVLDGNLTDLVLSHEKINDLALTIYWSDNGEISLSNPLVAAPENATSNVVQFSSDENFETVEEQQANAGVFQMQFTHYELNAILSKLLYAEGVKAPLYIRVKSSLGANFAPTYSNVMKLNVTPYVIDMTQGIILSNSKEDTGLRLYSKNSDGVYEGFVGASGWYNFYLREGDGTVWGNDGTVGTPFVLSNDESTMWNFWYPGITGCYYTIIDTNKSEWSSLLIPALSISGDVNGEMVYDRQTNKWSYSFNATSTGTVNVKISGSGKQYNVATGTDDSAATDVTVGFSTEGGKIVFGSTASDIAVNVPATGEVSIVLDLSDPKNYTCTTGSGSSQPTVVSEFLYLSGVDDGFGNSWNFDNYLRLYNEDELGYGGACNINSLWGYRIYTEADNWDSAYTMADGGTATSGKLIKVENGNTTNITAPTAGLYLIDVSLSSMSYNLTAIQSVSYSGLNDDWAGFTPMAATSNAGEYSCEITISKVSEWGFKIYINDDWNKTFGGRNGELTLYSSGITDDATLGTGTYTLTVDLCKGTYSITK